MKHHMIDVGDVALHVVTDGPEDGPPVILLHGVPEFWYMWRAQITALSEAGYRVIAPDQRGFNLSDKPKGVEAYGMDPVSEDVIGLMGALGYDRARLVGHDWGGVIAWWVANKYPERLEQLVVVSTPHHRVMGQALRHDSDQRRRSRYMLFFQLPVLPELALRLNNWGFLVRSMMRRTAREGTFSEDDINRYREAWSRPGAITGMLNYYRALNKARPARLPSPRIRVPTMLITGGDDAFFSPELGPASIDLCDDGRLVHLEDASHWIAQESAGVLNGLLIDFFGE